jgi:hypothetical protein
MEYAREVVIGEEVAVREAVRPYLDDWYIAREPNSA